MWSHDYWATYQEASAARIGKAQMLDFVLSLCLLSNLTDPYLWVANLASSAGTCCYGGSFGVAQDSAAWTQQRRHTIIVSDLQPGSDTGERMMTVSRIMWELHENITQGFCTQRRKNAFPSPSCNQSIRTRLYPRLDTHERMGCPTFDTRRRLWRQIPQATSLHCHRWDPFCQLFRVRPINVPQMMFRTGGYLLPNHSDGAAALAVSIVIARQRRC